MAAASDRVTAAQANAAEGVTPPPLRRLQDVVSEDRALSEYLDWSKQPFGQLIVGALRDLALWGPPATLGSETAVQHGVTIGLALAARLIEDPSAVIHRRIQQQSAPPQSFATSVDDALDSL
jgi:hypothetical protein